MKYKEVDIAYCVYHISLKDSSWEHCSKTIRSVFHMAKEKHLPKKCGINVNQRRNVFSEILYSIGENVDAVEHVCRKPKNTVSVEFRMKSSV